MNRVLSDVLAILGSNCIYANGSRNLGVIRTAELSKCLNCVVLTNFNCNTGSHGKFGDHFCEFWDEMSVDLEELFGTGLVEVEELQSSDM